MRSIFSVFIICLLALISCNKNPKEQFFTPGELWPDNNGVHINAHGGGILFDNGKYYWFGEHKTEGENGNLANVGVHCYSSSDLYSWHDEGIALAVAEENSGSDIEKGCILERPKVIYNKKTNKYVMWFHLEPKGKGYLGALSGIAVSDNITGPYTYVKAVRPNAGHWPLNVKDIHKGETLTAGIEFTGGSLPGDVDSLNILGRDMVGGQMARDMTLFVDDDRKAYHIYSSEENSTLHIAELTDDYQGHSGVYTRNFPGRFMEAPAMFKKDGKYYLMMSGCTGWSPNQARSAVAESILGEWRELGDPCIGDTSKTTFRSQSTYILPVQGKKDQFIYMGDRWTPKNAIDGRYIWLPVKFEGERFFIEWTDKWSLDGENNTQEKPLKEVVENAFDFAEKQSLLMAQKYEAKTDSLPKTFEKGKDISSDSGWWCSGFFPGTLWYLYENNNSPEVLRYAKMFTDRIEREKYTTNNHDVGFMLYCSFGNGLRLTGEERYKEVLLTGARSLATRYKDNIGLIRSWDFNRDKWQYPVIIDNMMNLELLLWAADYSGDTQLKKMAISHADKTMEHHFRPDYSSYHVISYDTISGLPHAKHTHQGLSHESAWSRGQAWGLYGYTYMYRETKDEKYLEHAKNIANYMIHHPNMPKDYIPYWDYDSPEIPNTSRDASAACIMASVLIELSDLVDKNLGKEYMDVAETQIRTLASPEYTANLGENGCFILKNSVGAYLFKSEVDVPLTYADYYYLEALMRLKKKEKWNF